MIAENHGVPLQMIAIMLWKDVMIKQILTDEGKAPNELIATAKKFRELFMNNTYQSQDVVKDIYVIDIFQNVQKQCVVTQTLTNHICPTNFKLIRFRNDGPYRGGRQSGRRRKRAQLRRTHR